MSDDSHGPALLGGAAARARLATEALDAAVASLPAGVLSVATAARFAAHEPHRDLEAFTVLEEVLAAEQRGDAIDKRFWEQLVSFGNALWYPRLTHYASGRGNDWPRRSLSELLAAFVMLRRFIPVDIFADIPETSERLNALLEAARMQAKVSDDTWANGSFDELVDAFAPHANGDAFVDRDALGELCYDLYEWLTSLTIQGERAPLFALCVWTVLEVSFRELQVYD